MDEIKVSVIVPVYNVENYIHQCLDSLMNQTLKEIEIILIDDYSTDGSGSICDDYAQKDGRVSVFHNQINLKQGSSRNKGIDIAKGEYLGFVDPDDWIDLDYYEKLYASAKRKNADIAKTSAIHVYSDGKLSKPTTFNRRIKKGLRKGRPLFLLFQNEHWTGIFKKDVLDNYNIRYPDIRNAEDDVFLLRCTYFSNCIELIKNTHYYYRHNDASTTKVRGIPFYESNLECFLLQIEFLNSVNIKSGYYKEMTLKYIKRLASNYRAISADPSLDYYKDIFFKKIIDSIIHLKINPNWYLDAFVLGGETYHIGNQLYHSFLEKIAIRTLRVIISIKNEMSPSKNTLNGR